MNTEPRQPRAFKLDDPALVTEPEPETAEAIPGSLPTLDAGPPHLCGCGPAQPALGNAAPHGPCGCGKPRFGRLVRAFRVGRPCPRRLGRHGHPRAAADCRFRGLDDRVARTDRLYAPGASRSPQKRCRCCARRTRSQARAQSGPTPRRPLRWTARACVGHQAFPRARPRCARRRRTADARRTRNPDAARHRRAAHRHPVGQARRNSDRAQSRWS